MYHRAAIRSTDHEAVLILNPWGQEAIRVHRLFRVLAQRLAQRGVDCLRFDFFGTGDSGGEDEDGELNGWVQDLRAADAELRQRSNAASITWIGARLGAALAVLAAESATETFPRRLVLWDPTFDGAAYLELLRTKHCETLEAAYGLSMSRAARRALAANTELTEAMGFGISSLLRQQLSELRLSTRSVRKEIDCVTLRQPRRSDAPLADHDATDKVALLAHEFDWTAEEALNSAMVPAKVLQRLTMAVIP